MQRRQDLPQELRQLIGAQEGLVTVAQANLVGVGDKALQRLVAQGHMMRPAKGLYDAAPLLETFEKRAWAALLLGGPEAAIGGHAALRLQGFEVDPDLVEVWVPPETQPVPLPGVRVRRDFLGRVTRRRGRISRIRVPRTTSSPCVTEAQMFEVSRARWPRKSPPLSDRVAGRATTPVVLAAGLSSPPASCESSADYGA